MKKHFYILIAFVLFSVFTTSAQTVKWLSQPDYDTISYYNKDIFKCSKNDKIQLVDISGKRLLPLEADSITDFTEGLALVLNKKGADFQIIGYLVEENHDFIEVNGSFFATFYSHFSEGLLAVADEKGNQGYLNTRGVNSIPCKFKKTRPFVHGWACVESQKERTVFIDKEGSYMIVQFHYGDLSIGTNFNEKGEALVGYTKNGQNDFAVINPSGRAIRTYTKRKGKPYRDYDFAFNEGVPDITPTRNDTPTFDSIASLYYSDGLYGYKNNDQDIIVPAQFSYAGLFADDCAIVAIDGKYGIIALVEGNFSSSIENSDILIRSNKITEFHYTLNIPETLDPTLLQVKFDNGDGTLKPIQLEQNTYTFTPFVGKNAKTCAIKAEIGMDGLLLWEETIMKKVNRTPTAALDFSAPSKATEYAGSDNHLKVKTIVTNKSDKPQKVSVTFASPVFQSGSKNSLASDLSNQEATLSVGEKKEFSITFKVNERETVKTSVTVKIGQQTIGTKTSNIELKPFDLIE
jgi:hypothetical protein